MSSGVDIVFIVLLNRSVGHQIQRGHICVCCYLYYSVAGNESRLVAIFGGRFDRSAEEFNPNGLIFAVCVLGVYAIP